ncbi:MAG: hypothetical protein INR71_03115, partial [Terriglobus roseus]|nr:hypothetical protein [Terriglobus roseus]
MHLARQSEHSERYLARICQYLSRPITSSPANGPGLALSILSTIFNLVPADDDARYHVFLAILEVVRASGSFDALRPQLGKLDRWLAEWETEPDDQRKLLLAIADVARDDAEPDE